MIADDLGVPSLSSDDLRVSIAVQRNEKAPEFDDAPYDRALDENHEVGTVVFTVQAEDDDKRVSIKV